MREIRAALMAQVEMSLKLQSDFWNFVKSYSEEVRRMNKLFAKPVQPQIPELKFADSALWMWIPQLKLRHSIWNNNRVWKDEFFRTDPATDYNN